MADTNLNDDMVKLVEFTILTIEREHERTLHGPAQIIVTDDLTGDAFSNARIAAWIEGPGKVDARSVKHSTLRVYYNVLDRWPKEDLKRDEKSLGQAAERIRQSEEQLAVLREIAAKLPPPDGGGGGAVSKSAK